MPTTEDLGDGELASSSFWLPPVQISPPSALQEALLNTAISKHSTSSTRPLRPGDWRCWAEAETGGSSVRPPEDFTFGLDNTPNIDDVRTRMDSDGELSTPGSDGGYNSPRTGAVMRATSAVRSSVHNPLFDDDRPAPPECGDSVAKALLLSPSLEPNGSAKATPRAAESDWSSPTSSITIMSAQQPNTSERTYTGDAAASGPPSAARLPQASGEPPSPMLAPLDLETPRRSIKSLSLVLSHASGATRSQGSVATASCRQGAPAAATPCGGKAPDAASPAVPGIRCGAVRTTDAAGTPCSAAAINPANMDVLQLSEAAASSPSEHAGDRSGSASPAVTPRTSINAFTAAADVSANAAGGGGHDSPLLQVDLDDTGGAGRGLDQTPRKAGRERLGKQAKQATPARQGAPSPATEVGLEQPSDQQPAPVAQLPAGQGQHSSKGKAPSRRAWSDVASWLVVVVAALAAISSTVERPSVPAGQPGTGGSW
ncbi:hypothetical protein TSOC_009289 [Tetrabaena socialis]|uniref:Uncharacterized protein n=1 Tax=Tetrabaena socialis TaxID=47790 RepID=A0A2J7ZWA2_9CHLO|nr:hypothetical protein TSOC_009289 [Tetrabaena socialis]|eukprot:PNH04557.1 hypothetical protein TSOC_009289 [Tetrabaena socialis]